MQRQPLEQQEQPGPGPLEQQELESQGPLEQQELGRLGLGQPGPAPQELVLLELLQQELPGPSEPPWRPLAWLLQPLALRLGMRRGASWLPEEQ